MKIYTAADHAGFELKESLIPFLQSMGHEVEDCGARELNERDDYPEIIACAASRIAADVAGDNNETRAIIFGKSGQGEAMVANRFRGVRAAVYYGKDTEIIRLSREHNDANVLSIGAGFVSEAEAKEAIQTWLATPFSGEERHVFRIKKIEEVNDVA